MISLASMDCGLFLSDKTKTAKTRPTHVYWVPRLRTTMDDAPLRSMSRSICKGVRESGKLSRKYIECQDWEQLRTEHLKHDKVEEGHQKIVQLWQEWRWGLRIWDLKNMCFRMRRAMMCLNDTTHIRAGFKVGHLRVTSVDRKCHSVGNGHFLAMLLYKSSCMSYWSLSGNIKISWSNNN